MGARRRRADADDEAEAQADRGEVQGRDRGSVLLSQENVDLVRHGYEVAYARRSVDGVAHLFADDYEWHQRREWPGREVYRRDELPELWAELDETYPEFDLRPIEFTDKGDCVLVKVKTSARVGASDDRIEALIWHVWRVADGLVTETRVFSDYEEALEACG